MKIIEWSRDTNAKIAAIYKASNNLNNISFMEK